MTEEGMSSGHEPTAGLSLPVVADPTRSGNRLIFEHERGRGLWIHRGMGLYRFGARSSRRMSAPTASAPILPIQPAVPPRLGKPDADGDVALRAAEPQS